MSSSTLNTWLDFHNVDSHEYFNMYLYVWYHPTIVLVNLMDSKTVPDFSGTVVDYGSFGHIVIYHLTLHSASTQTDLVHLGHMLSFSASQTLERFVLLTSVLTSIKIQLYPPLTLKANIQ